MTSATCRPSPPTSLRRFPAPGSSRCPARATCRASNSPTRSTRFSLRTCRESLRGREYLPATARGTDGNSFYGLAIGFTVLAGAFAVVGISGGAFNPAVAIGAMVTGLLEWGNIRIYLIADLLGAAVAAYVFLFALPAEKETGDIEAAATE